MNSSNNTYPNGTPRTEPRYTVGSDSGLHFVYDREADDIAGAYGESIERVTELVNQLNGVKP